MSQIKYDLLIKGGRLIDPSQGIDGIKDVAIRQGRISAIADDIPKEFSLTTINASDHMVTPGLIDMHTHVFEGLGPCVPADPIGSHSGVTTMVDTGSAGASNFALFRDLVIPKTITRILPFLNIWLPGLEMAGWRGFSGEFTDEHALLDSPQGLKAIGYFDDLDYAPIDSAIKMIKESQGIIVGVKVWMGTYTTGTLKPLEHAIAVGEATGLPVMLDNWVLPPVSAALDLLRPGDIFTHIYGRNCGIVDQDNKVVSAAFAARERGVRFDVGHGCASFDYAKVKNALDQGFLPDTISTDIHKFNIDGPVVDLPTTMTKFLALGLNLNEVIRMVTSCPAAILGIDGRIGSLKPGMEADVAVLDLKAGKFDLLDSAVTGDTTKSGHMTSNVMLTCVQTIKAGKVL